MQKLYYNQESIDNISISKTVNGNAITDPNHVGKLNPFRYRGYYLDTETGFYYLMSRYYDPVTHRFVNSYGYFQAGSDILDTNMNAYCRNNPINFCDSSGTKCSIHGDHYYVPTCVIRNPGYALASAKYKAKKRKESNLDNLPTSGESNSSQSKYNPDGTIKQKRWYGPDGNAVRDRIYNHSGNFEFPHDHEWINGKRGKEHLPPSPEYQFSWEPFIGIGITAVCVIGIVVIAVDDVSGIGVADDFLLGPLGTGVASGVVIAFG